jgi:predicted ATPase
MPAHGENFFVITGGPGAGKTSLIDALRGAGFACVAEAGRQIIRDQICAGGTALPWRDRALYAEMMLARDLLSYGEHGDTIAPVFFDRGIPDVMGYLRLEDLAVPEHLSNAARRLRYNRRVFLCPPWPEIFVQDSERKQTIEIAARTSAALAETYTALGYALVEVPKLPLDARLRFVIDAVRLTPPFRPR